MRLLPGGPFDQERKLPPEIQLQMQKKYQLDKPVIEQYVIYLGNVIKGDFGPSYKYPSRSAFSLVKEASLVSFRLGYLALLLGIGLGVLGNIVMQLYPNHSVNRWIETIGVISLGLPNFLFGALLVLVFSFWLNVLPAARLEGPLNFVLPVIALSLTPFTLSFAVLNSSLSQVVNEPFVKIKKSFGLNPLNITVTHVLRNGLIPLIAIFGPLTAGLLTGSFSTEVIFGLPGLGKYFVTAVINRDYTVVMAITVLYSLLLIIANLIGDLLLAWADPRIAQGMIKAEEI